MNLNWTLALLFSFSIYRVQAEPKVFEMTETGADIRVPNGVWKQIDTLSAGKESITFAPVRVRLVEKTPQVLIEPEILIHLSRGGGEIDLSRFVNDKQGTFSVFFEFEEIKDEFQMKAFFVSQAKKRKIDDEVWGAGCHKFMDVKNFLLKGGKTKGIEVNTTRNRHVSVLGGHFVFAMNHEVTQVTFTDSKQPQLFCGVPDKAKAKDND
jgi:hypothetical protein